MPELPTILRPKAQSQLGFRKKLSPNRIRKQQNCLESLEPVNVARAMSVTLLQKRPNTEQSKRSYLSKLKTG